MAGRESLLSLLQSGALLIQVPRVPQSLHPVEPVVGIIKRVLSFEQFSLRGLQNVALEWNLVCMAYNLKRLHKLTHPPKQKPRAPKIPKPMPLAVGELLGLLFSHSSLAFP
jgi:hypothetical protein